MNMEEESQNSKPKDNFLFENLPGVEDMLTKTLPNKDLLYYPYNYQQNNSLNVFDFTFQKKGGEIDESVPTEKANTPQQKNKRNQNQKYQSQRYNQNQKYKNQGNKSLYQVNQKFNINQTIQPESNWVLIKDFNKRILEKCFVDFNKIKVTNKEICGTIYPVNDSFEEEISPYSPKLLKRYDNMKFYGYTNTSSDNKLLNLDYSVNVYTTDKILAVLMTCIYNSYPWHLKFRKMGDKIFIEKMSNSEIDKVTVNESDNTSTIYDDRNINSFKNLNIEATLINEFIKEQVIDKENGEPYPSTSPNPLNDEEDDNDDSKVEHLGYIYRLWNLEGIKILVRSQVHAYQVAYDDESSEEGNDQNEEKEEKEEESEEKDESDEEKEKKKKYQFINIFALNEFDKNNYLNKENNLGSTLLKKELKNNYLKLTKWGILSYLAGAKKIKLAFVTREKVDNNEKHLISTIYNLNTDDLLFLTNFGRSFGWGIFKEIISMIKNYKEDGYFILMKTFGETSAKSLLRLFKVPDSYFKSEETQEE